MTHPVSTSRRFVLARRPHGQVREEDFALMRADVGAVPDGGVLLETLFISLDPAIRSWLDDRPSYLPPVAIGDPVRSLGLARVTESRNPAFCVGDIVRGFTGWQERHVVPSPGAEWARITPKPGVPLETWLGALGMTGLTAWIGVYDILRPSAGDTVLVTAAGGAVGSLAAQLAKRAGARVIGTAGGAEKCDLLTTRLGLDAAVDRRADDWRDHLAAAAPAGIDRVFENAGAPCSTRPSRS
ncbi:MDR family NADP-dependent oxidoreductase [Streptomyces malaysiensis]|uniref:NADP-dependent oxidoreductase n=1 Tax=Streptomyces malaysiensis subsp. samsunensis TaxID=459658 RepID=A0A9X2RVK3_STRMQ|nr:NADP-dependent oxidoreductase [Streptomyces samsunensis]MCQ8832138.1 NADP-dependent oxidoreductase [Streptomyces samsunensis]